MKVRLSRQARRDLASISRYTLEEFGPQQQERYLAGLLQHFDTLARFPNLGQEVDPATGRRVSTHEKHRVLYLPGTDGVSIARVLHSAQQREYEKALHARTGLERSRTSATGERPQSEGRGR